MGIGQFTAMHKSQVQVLQASIQERNFGFVSGGDAARSQGSDGQETLDTDVISRAQTGVVVQQYLKEKKEKDVRHILVLGCHSLP